MIDATRDASHAEALRENLEEERGDPSSPRLEDRPHFELDRAFFEPVADLPLHMGVEIVK